MIKSYNRSVRFQLLIFLLTVPSVLLFGQSAYLSSLDTWIIGPDNVDVHYAEQKEYYNLKLDGLMDRLIKEKSKSGTELINLNRSDKKDKSIKKELKDKIKNIDGDILSIEHYRNLWRDVLIDGKELSIVSWQEFYQNELRKEVSRVMIQKSTTKYVKKKKANCVSRSPDDCIEMCLVTTPAKYKKVTKNIRQTCADGYRQDLELDRCINYVVIRNVP